MGGLSKVCEVCGATHGDGDVCAVSADSTAEVANLRLLPAGSSETAPTNPPEVRLIREFKGPTVEDLLEDEADKTAKLPAQVREVLHAIESGDYRRASSSLDESIGGLLQGPGFRRRSRDHIGTNLLLLGFIAVALWTVVTWIWI